MAIQADKKPPENKSFHERIVDFSGGLNTTISGALLNSNEAQVAINTSLEQKGTLRPRRGRQKRYVTPFADTPVTGLGVYYKNDGTSRILVTSGDKIYSDAPHMSTKWNEKADWETTGTTLSGYGSTTQVEGSVTSRQQEMGVAARCEDALLWTPKDATLSVSTDTYFLDGKSIEILIGADKTAGYAHKALRSTLDTSKYGVLCGYLKRGTGTNIKLVGLTSGGNVSKSGTTITATTWTKSFIKLSPADLVLISTFGVNVNGTEGQTGYMTGVYFKYITEDEYNNSGYTPPDLDYFEAYTKVNVLNYLNFASGISNNTTVVSNNIVLSIEFAALNKSYSSQAEFDTGIKTNVSTVESVDSVVLARQV